MRRVSLVFPCLLLALGACATTDRTAAEDALAADLESTNIIPASFDERQAIRSQDLLTQAAFWAEAHDLNPSDLEAATELSIVLRKLGNPVRAAEIGRQTLALYPDNHDLLLAYGTALASSGRGAAALEPLNRALTQRSDDWRVLNALGVAYDQAGDPDQARQHFQRALDLEPAEASILSNLALSHAMSGDPATAERLLREAMIRPGADATIRQNLALVLALQGRFQEAEDMASVDTSPDMVDANMAYIRAMLTTTRRYDALRTAATGSR